MRKIIFFILIPILGRLSFSLDTNSVKYLPLKVGNIWVYQVLSYNPPANYRLQARVIRDTLIGNKKYFYTSLPFSYLGIPYSWIRIDSVSGNLYGIGAIPCVGNSVQLIDSLAANTNDTEYVCNLPPMRRECDTVYTTTYCGQQTIRKIFRNSGTMIYYDIRSYIRNVGINYADHGEPPNNITLTGCVINGVVCGDTSMMGIHQISGEIPIGFKLYQNYPNPFNPTTKIQFEIPNISPPFMPACPSGRKGGQGGLTTLVIYDLLGREVTTLVNEKLSSGTYEIEFDGSNYPSEVYFYTLKTENYSNTKKMVLIK